MIDTLVHEALSLYPLAMVLLLAVGLLVMTALKPSIGCGFFAFAISVTTGLGRGTLIPLLRPNEAILLLVLAGVVIHYLPRRQRWAVTGLDLAVAGYTVGVVVISLLVLLIPRSPSLFDLDTLRAVFSPLQFLLVYLIFSRVDLSSREVQAMLNLTMLASLVVGLLAVAQLADLPGVRNFVVSYFTPPFDLQPSWDPVYRPTSTLGHYSAVAAFATVNFVLALTLATHRHPAFPKLWLVTVMVVNAAALVASLTWAPLLVLPLLVVLVLWFGRHIPVELGMTAAAVAVAVVVLWPAVSGRGAVQGIVSSSGLDLVVPTSFAYRLTVWNAYFVPALSDHLLLGTGTVIPSEVPTPLVNFVDNEYLREGFRAGIAGIGLLAVMLTTIGVAGWRARKSADPMRRTLGAVSLALVVFFPLVGFTAEYMFFAGVSQEFAMLTGLLGASSVAAIRQAVPLRLLPTAAGGRARTALEDSRVTLHA